MRTRIFAVGVIAIVLVASLSAQKADDKGESQCFCSLKSTRADSSTSTSEPVNSSPRMPMPDSHVPNRCGLSKPRKKAVIVVEVGSYTVVKDKADSLAALANTLNTLAGGLASLSPRLDESHKATYRNSTLSIGDFSTELESESAAPLSGTNRGIRTN